MNRKKITSPTPLSSSAYLIISVIGLLVSVFCVYYYLHNIQGNVSENVSGKVFYLILIVFGIAASAMVFGAMNSYGVLSGQKWDTKFQFAGPVVGVLLVVLGGFYLPKSTSKKNIAIRLLNERRLPVTNGKVIIYFSNYTREESINDKGTAVFSDINEEDVNDNVKIDVVSDGYARRTFDTSLKGYAPLEVTLSTDRLVRISGQVTDADDKPIKDVEIVAEGTRFFSRSINNGTYTLQLADYVISDEILLVTSHKDYKDKTRAIRINKQHMTQIDFVLQPLQNE